MVVWSFAFWMHPHLGLHAHPMCKNQILALQDCHKSNPVRRFMGACNEARRVLDVCLGEEFEAQRLENLAKRNERNANIK